MPACGVSTNSGAAMSEREESPLAITLPSLAMPRPSLRALAALAVLGAPALAAQRAPIEIPLQHGRGQLRTMRVRVGGDTADYMFDTGGGVTVISPQDSARLGCTPGGAGFGVRLTGQQLSGRKCANVTLGVGPFDATDDAGVMDLAKMVGAPNVRGMIALPSFRDRAITLDLAHDRLIVETPKSLAARVRGMTPVDVRLATGEGGGNLVAFIGVRAPNGAKLWLEWDSENGAPTLLSPHAVALLGGDSATRAQDLRVPLAAGLDVTLPVLVKKDMIHDGVLSAGFLERATWTLDLARGRMWVGTVAPILELPTATAQTTPPARDPVGVYYTTLMVRGAPQHEVLEIKREGNELRGRARAIGEDHLMELRDVTLSGDTLSYRIMISNPVPVRVTFDGLVGTGAWGDPAARGGEMRLEKRR